MASASSGRRRVGVIFASQWLQRLVRLAIPLVLTPLALKTLGQDVYGAFLLAAALTGYATQDLGIPQVLVDVTATGLARNEHDRIASHFRHAVVALLLLAAIVVIAALPLSSALELGTTSSGALVLVAMLTAAASLPLSAVRGAAEGLQDVHELNLVSTAALLVSVPFTIWCLVARPSPLWLFLPTIASSVGAELVMLVRLLRRHPWLGKAQEWSWSVLRTLLKRGGWFALVGVAWTVIYNTDVWIIQRTSGLDFVAPYGIVFVLFGFLGEPVGTLVMALRPVAARLGAEEPRAAGHLLRKTARLSMVLGLVAGGAGLLWYRPVMDLWVGPGVVVDFRVALFLALFQALRALLNACAWLLIPLEGPRPLALALTGDAVINLVLSIVLGILVGPWGVAAGSFAGIALCSGWYIPSRARSAFGVSPLGKWLLGALAGAAPLWIAAAALQPSMASFRGPPGYGLLVAGAAATVAWAAYLVIAVGLEPEERELVLGKVRGLLARG